MIQTVFRRAVLADLPAIVALLADDHLGAGREDPRLPLDPGYLAGFEAVDRDPNQLLAVAQHGDAVVGTLLITFLPGVQRKGGWRGQIEAVRIAAPLRGGGLGAQMMAWAEDQCRARGCHVVQLTSDNSRGGAHRFYARIGYAQSHAGFKKPL